MQIYSSALSLCQGLSDKDMQNLAPILKEFTAYRWKPTIRAQCYQCYDRDPYIKQMYVLFLKPESILQCLRRKHNTDYSFVNTTQTKTFDLLSVTGISIAEYFFPFWSQCYCSVPSCCGFCQCDPCCRLASSTWPYPAVSPADVGRTCPFHLRALSISWAPSLLGQVCLMTLFFSFKM